MKQKVKVCPKCGAINPKTISDECWDYGPEWQMCINIVDYKRNIFGMIRPIYCKSKNIRKWVDYWNYKKIKQ